MPHYKQKGRTTIIEKEKSRNHTEEWSNNSAALFQVVDKTITIAGGQQLTGQEVTVPGDISSAAFYLVAASLLPDSNLQLNHVGINPTRTGILDVLEKMGANIQQVALDKQNQAADLLIKTRH